MAEREEILIEQLVQQAKTGEREAFSRIVSLMMNKVVALTYKMTGDKETAKDFILLLLAMLSYKKYKRFYFELRFLHGLGKIYEYYISG